jgi:hypothetical protein
MRSLTVIVSIGSVLLFAAGPVFAQHVASTPFVRDCSPGEPDSLQISWTAPCDSGTLLLDTEVGCRMWDWHPEPEDKVVWKGACKGALPDGPGEAQWFEHGRPIDRFVGRYRNGAREGEGHYVWNETVRFDGRYAGNVPDGPGVLKIDGDTFAGDWQAGCLVGANGQVVAIGVPRTSCARNWARSHRLDLEHPRPPSKRYATSSLSSTLGKTSLVAGSRLGDRVSVEFAAPSRTTAPVRIEGAVTCQQHWPRPVARPPLSSPRSSS